MLSLRVLALLLSVAVASCQDAPSESFYLLTGQDMRLCPAPYCGGLFIQEVNNKTAPTLMVVSVLLPPKVQAEFDDYVFRFGYKLVFFKGFLEPYSENFKDAFNLNVTVMYLGLPGTVVDTNQTFYTVSNMLDESAARAIILNRRQSFLFNKTTMTTASPAEYVDAGWQRSQILSYGAIVAATAQESSDGVTLANLDIKAAFIKLPLPEVQCLQRDVVCTEANNLGYKRNSLRCFSATCIRIFAPCAVFCPKCATGYKLAMWTGPVGCPEYACDPYFLPNATMLTCDFPPP